MPPAATQSPPPQTSGEIAPGNGVCNAKPRGDFGRITRIGYPGNPDSNSFPTKITATLIPALEGSSSHSSDRVTVWCLAVGRECGNGPQFAYVDPDTRSLMFLTLVATVDDNFNQVGNMGFITYNDDGIQINKTLLSRPLNFSDFLDPRALAVDRASDGSEVVDGIPLGNPNCGKVNQLYDSVIKEGGKRKTKRSKKSKRHTRR